MTLKSRLDAVISNALEKRIVGCVVLVRQNGKDIYANATGFADREEKREIQRDTIFRLASVTKPITATVALRIADAGLLALDDHVTKYLPWFTPTSPDGKTHPITIRQLLSHSSGVSYGMNKDISGGLSGPLISLEENLRRVAKVPLAFAPGTGWTYGMGIDVVGGVIAAIEGTTLEAAMIKYVCDPLGMKDTRFHVTDLERLAVQYGDGDPPFRMKDFELLADRNGFTVPFTSSRIFEKAAPQSGGAGTAGTADDVMAVLDSYVSAKPILKPSTIASALSNQIGDVPRADTDAGKRFGLIGAVIEDQKLSGSSCPNGTVEWAGAWGNNWFIDPTNRITTVICTNTAFEGCMGPFTDEIRAAIYA